MLEVNNELSAEAVLQSIMMVTDFHLVGEDSGLHQKHWEEEKQHEWMYKRKGEELHFPLALSKHV